MTLQKRVLITLALTMVILVTLLFFSSRLILLHSLQNAEQNEVTELYLIFAILIIPLVFLGVTLKYIDAVVPDRLSRLSASVRQIGRSGNIAQHVAITGSDELARLAEDINGMLAALEKSQDALRAREELLSEITNNMADVIMKVDAENTILYISPSYSSVFGYAVEDRLGLSGFELLHPEDTERVKATYRRGIKGKYIKTDKAEYRVRHADGHYLWIESAGKVLRDDRGRFTGFVVSVRDITERKHTELFLAQSEERFRELFESAPVGIVFTRGGNILLANRSFRSMFDPNSTGFPDQPLLAYMAPDYHQEILSRLLNLERDANAPRMLEALGLKRDGSTFPVYIELSHLDLQNSAPSVVAFITDIAGRN